MPETKGRGWHGDPQGHAEAGRKGGKRTARKHGREYFSEIGKKGGEKSSGSLQKGSERARESGSKGGRSQK